MAVAFGWSLQGRGMLAGREALTTLARRAEALGYDSSWVTDRLLIPTKGANDGPSCKLEAVALCQHGDFSSPAGAVSLSDDPGSDTRA